jgi:hypothetical protein
LDLISLLLVLTFNCAKLNQKENATTANNYIPGLAADGCCNCGAEADPLAEYN